MITVNTPSLRRFPAIVLAIGFLSPGLAADEILCPGDYGGHLQGLAVDDRGAIYWSFTVRLVKTDVHGKLLASTPVPSHHGDVTYHEGKLYCAVNLGQFNRQPGQADSWVHVFRADDLSLLAKHKTAQLIHGAGGMAYYEGRHFVVGGLPEGYKENYVYEYDDEFRFLGRHVIDSGYTLMGIQTACRADNRWWFGCYGGKLLVTDDAFRLVGKYDLDFAIGLVELPDGRVLQGRSFKEGDRWRGKAVIVELPEVDGSGG